MAGPPPPRPPELRSWPLLSQTFPSFELQLDQEHWIQVLGPNGWGVRILCGAGSVRVEGMGVRICADGEAVND